MRNEGGFEVIKKAIEKLQLKHKEHIAAYGEGNERRLTGRHETADINTFSWVFKMNDMLSSQSERHVLLFTLYMMDLLGKIRGKSSKCVILSP